MDALWEEVLNYFDGSVPKTLRWLGAPNTSFQMKNAT